jgi:hypothetical protein
MKPPVTKGIMSKAAPVLKQALPTAAAKGAAMKKVPVRGKSAVAPGQQLKTKKKGLL